MSSAEAARRSQLTREIVPALHLFSRRVRLPTCSHSCSPQILIGVRSRLRLGEALRVEHVLLQRVRCRGPNGLLLRCRLTANDLVRRVKPRIGPDSSSPQRCIRVDVFLGQRRLASFGCCWKGGTEASARRCELSESDALHWLEVVMCRKRRAVGLLSLLDLAAIWIESLLSTLGCLRRLRLLPDFAVVLQVTLTTPPEEHHRR